MRFLPRNINASAWAAALERGDILDSPCGSRSHVTGSFNAFFPLKLIQDPKRWAMKSPLCVKLPDSQKERIQPGDQKAALPLQKTSPISSGKCLQPEGAAKTKRFRAILLRGKEIKGTFFRNGRARASHAKSRHKGAVRRSLPLKGTVSSLPAFPYILSCPRPLFSTC